MKHFETYLVGMLGKSNIHFLKLHFKQKRINEPSILDILSIKEEDLMQSWLSMASVKEFLLFQQQLRNDISGQEKAG